MDGLRLSFCPFVAYTCGRRSGEAIDASVGIEICPSSGIEGDMVNDELMAVRPVTLLSNDRIDEEIYLMYGGMWSNRLQ